MASGSKSDSVFTKNPLGDGASAGIVTKSIGDGQSIKSAYPQDNVHGVSLPDTKGGSFRGSPTNLSHSLTGTSAVQDGPGAAGSVKHQRRS
jgi:hypothetical protein